MWAGSRCFPCSVLLVQLRRGRFGEAGRLAHGARAVARLASGARGSATGQFLTILAADDPLAVRTTAFCAVQPPPPGTRLRELFPRLTGTNGYEDFVLAGEFVRADSLLDRIETRGNPTLAEKRKILARRDIVRALALLRRGLTKPVSPPVPTDPDSTSPLRAFALLRQLTRVLVMEQYVLFADGKTREALASMRDGLKLGRVVDEDDALEHYGALALRMMATETAASRLEQLSARDCEEILRTCREWAAAPDRSRAILANLRREAREQVDDYAKDPRKLHERLSPNEELRAAVEQAAKRSPDGLQGVLAEVRSEISRYADQIEAELGRTPWERRTPQLELSETADGGGTAAERLALQVAGEQRWHIRLWLLVSGSCFPYDFAESTWELTRIRLFACHAGILRFRWEHNRLPGSLEEVGLGELAVDPYTGRPLEYERGEEGNSRRYRLASAGPVNEETGDRVPVVIPTWNR
jgi:hypothetical protein